MLTVTNLTSVNHLLENLPLPDATMVGDIIVEAIEEANANWDNLFNPLGQKRLEANSWDEEKIGNLIAKRSIEKGVKKVVFDKGSYAYHGKVKALAESARKSGLDF